MYIENKYLQYKTGAGTNVMRLSDQELNVWQMKVLFDRYI